MKKMGSLKVPHTTHVNIESEILLKNNIPYSIAGDNWIEDHPEVLETEKNKIYSWKKIADFLSKNIIGVLILIVLIIGLKKSLSKINNANKVIKPDQIKGSIDDLIGMEDIKREILTCV